METEALDPKSPSFLRDINVRLGAQISGHYRSRLKGFCVALSSKTKNKLALIYVGDPGSYKTTMTEIILANFDNVLELTSATARSLNYLTDEQIAKGILWMHEFEGARELSLDLKSLLSDGRLARSVTVKDPKTNRYVTQLEKTEWEPTFISTQNEILESENATANRILFENVDQSETQIGNALKWIARRDSLPHTEDPQSDRSLERFLIGFNPQEDVLITFLEPIADRLPKKKTHIFRRFNQLRYLIKLIACVHREQRVHCVIDEKSYIVAHPIDLQYAIDILGPRSMAGITDKRLDMIYDRMEPDEEYSTRDLADLFDRTPGWIRPLLTILEDEGRIERVEKVSRSFYWKRVEGITPEDPLQLKHVEGYGYQGPLFKKWVEENNIILSNFPKKEPEYINPVLIPSEIASSSSERIITLNNAQSGKV